MVQLKPAKQKRPEALPFRLNNLHCEMRLCGSIWNAEWIRYDCMKAGQTLLELKSSAVKAAQFQSASLWHCPFLIHSHLHGLASLDVEYIAQQIVL